MGTKRSGCPEAMRLMNINRSQSRRAQFSLTTLFVWMFWIGGGLTILRAAQSDAAGRQGRMFCSAVFAVWVGAALGDLGDKSEYGALIGAFLAFVYALIALNS